MRPAAKGRVVEQSIVDAIPPVSTIAGGYNRVDSVTSRMACRPLHSVEGVWVFPSEGTMMAIERPFEGEEREAEATIYRMVVVRAADPTLRPGTVMGWLTPTAKRGVFDCRIYTSTKPDGVTLCHPKNYTLTLTDSDSRLEIASYGTKFRFNWWRLLPYMYRYLVTRQEKSPGNIYGCVRVYPAPEIPAEPRYL